MVFDHMNEDSMPEQPSCDLEEQPTVVLVEEMNPREMLNPRHKSKERNASLLNSSALSRDQ